MVYRLFGLALACVLVLTGCGDSDSSDPAPMTQLGDQEVQQDGSIEYIDYKGERRAAPASAADAEYHTGKGYGHTLFDSADNKCQNCHNELYDTWKDSMHGKSWSDPIFQSKFQDFLRTHLAKIGDDKTAKGGVVYQQAEVGVGSKNMFSGAAQTCIKCHAPGAYYAGDVNVTVTELQDAGDMNTSMLAALKATHEVNNPSGQTAVIAANAHQNKIYKATFQIGHEANREGINCAFCHSIETPRMMEMGDQYTLKKDMRVGPHGPLKAALGTTLDYDADATAADMNKFFRIWGPEKPTDYASTAKSATDTSGRAADGRYTMASKDLNGTDGKVHFTGGPFYGPFGVTGTRNENASDETNRSALVNPHFDYDNSGGNGEFNHFAAEGKGLCLSCHQRSAGAAVPSGHEGAGDFMELCSTQMAVTTGSDTPTGDTDTSPKCQKCHMERIDGTVLHQWGKPNQLFTDKALLTSHFFPDDSEGHGDDNPVKAKWLNSHAFLGASKTGHKSSATAKIQSGFSANVATSNDGSTLTVTTTLTNKTAHMFPGAHPMRRVLTRVIVTDATGAMLTPTAMSGNSTFGDITNTLVTLQGKTLHSSQATTVSVEDAGNHLLDFPGKVDDLDGSAVSSQRFYSANGVGKVDVTAVDATVKTQSVTAGATKGKVFNAAIVDANSSLSKKFTRIYGHETGKMLDHDSDGGTAPIFVVRPGFDSNVVASDTRLSPNETETYTLTYDISGLSGVSTTYKVYYMQKGANGQFLEADDGFLDQSASDAAKHLVTEVFTKTVSE